MTEYIFKVMLADSRVRYYTTEANNISEARKEFKRKSKRFPEGWCLLRVYREVK